MPIRGSKNLVFKPRGLSDAVDGTNVFPGALKIATNLIPSSDTQDTWVPRPAAVELSSYSGFTSPGFVSASLVVGNIEYGMIASGLHAGKDQPYAYNLLTGTFLTVNGIQSTNVPTSPVTTGSWTPPIMSVVGNRVIVCHPGFPGGTVKFGWFDLSSFSYTGSIVTNGTTTITSATNLLTSGVQPGQTITKADIPAGATIVSIAVNGLSAVISAAATGSTTSSATIAGGTSTTPLWGAGDTNINNLPSIPVSVVQFNGRAYYACGINGVPYTDSLLPCNRTNANQALTFANGLAVTALGPLLLASPVTGGIVQAVMAFQGASAIQQITGDQATSNLAVNAMNVATGTLAPLSITPTDFGLAFISPDGLRVIQFSGQVSDPIGFHGEGVTIPFIYAVQPTRVCAAATADVLRISTQNGNAVNSPNQEYWFDIAKKVWSGPHTFPASLIQPWGDTFVVHPVGIPGTIFQSDANISAASSFTENGTPLQWQRMSCLMPDNQMGCMNALVQSTLSASLPTGYNLTVSAFDETGATLGTAAIIIPGTATTWDAFNWGGASWLGGVGAFTQHRVPWMAPIVYKQVFESLRGLSAFGVEIGNSYFNFQELGYMLQ